jgi:hypothetical protein
VFGKHIVVFGKHLVWLVSIGKHFGHVCSRKIKKMIIFPARIFSEKMLTNAYHAYHYFWKVFAVETCGKKKERIEYTIYNGRTPAYSIRTSANTIRTLAYASLQRQNTSQH